MPIHRLRVGFTSKIHARCDNQGRPLGFVLTGGQVSDYKAVNALMALPAPKPRAMLADRDYDSDSFRQDLLIHRILPVISSCKGRKTPQQTDWQRYRERNHIERMFNRLKQMRHIAARYDRPVSPSSVSTTSPPQGAGLNFLSTRPNKSLQTLKTRRINNLLLYSK
ncbi:transposase [Gluconobacter roseus]|uniref:transposase n=1 Tax=Gluconobacter roseus TaxID=586239 RepID=UPI001E403153|nr:transposase [Gluconobacter roseus]